MFSFSTDFNTFIRNFCVNPSTDSNGRAIGGIMGTLKSLKAMVRETKPHRVFFVWDAEGGSQRRRGVMAEYKSGRKPRLNREVGEDESVGESHDNMSWQIEKTKQLLKHLGVTQVEVPNIEADDAIGYLVGCLEPRSKCLVSSDRDMWQLVSDTTVVYWPTKKVYISKETFSEHSDVLAENFVLARAITGKGDASDNIHGVKGIGDKTVVKIFPFLAERPVELSDVFKHAEEHLDENRWYKAVLDNRELVSQNVALMQLKTPEMSGNAGSIIREAVNRSPSFNTVGFQLAMINCGIQVTDQELQSVIREYQMRVQKDAA